MKKTTLAKEVTKEATMSSGEEREVRRRLRALKVRVESSAAQGEYQRQLIPLCLPSPALSLLYRKLHPSSRPSIVMKKTLAKEVQQEATMSIGEEPEG